MNLRTRLGLTQAELGDLLGVSQPAVSAWEAGRRTPTGGSARFFARLRAAEHGPVRSYGWFRAREIVLPAAWWEPVVDRGATVRLPIHLEWTPRAASARDLADPVQRSATYAKVLDAGEPFDVRVWIDPGQLVAAWPDLPVARHLVASVADLVATLKAARVSVDG